MPPFFVNGVDMRSLLLALALLIVSFDASAYKYKVRGPGAFDQKGTDSLTCADVLKLGSVSSSYTKCYINRTSTAVTELQVTTVAGNTIQYDMGPGWGVVWIEYWPDSCPTPRYTGLPDVTKPPGSQCTRASCPAGDDAGNWKIPTAYYDKRTNQIVQRILADGALTTAPAPRFCPDGCTAAVDTVSSCTDNEAVDNNLWLTKCSVHMVQIDGTKCTASTDFEKPPGYTGPPLPDTLPPTDGGGTTTPPGGSTDPGGSTGTDPGGSTGTTPGGGTGTTPGGGTGTTPGGTGTDPGTGTGTGTTPGGTGSSDAHCGATGQPPCKIDESGTPSGVGSLFDPLNKWLDGLGGREGGLSDATKDDGKDTSIGFGLNLPSGACTDPSVGLPNISGRWTVPICKYLPMISAFFEFLWVFFFVFAVMQLVARATSKPVA